MTCQAGAFSRSVTCWGRCTSRWACPLYFHFFNLFRYRKTIRNFNDILRCNPLLRCHTKLVIQLFHCWPGSRVSAVPTRSKLTLLGNMLHAALLQGTVTSPPTLSSRCRDRLSALLSLISLYSIVDVPVTKPVQQVNRSIVTCINLYQLTSSYTSILTNVYQQSSFSISCQYWQYLLVIIL